MKLLHVHIDGFGKLTGYDRDLDGGLNTILEDNGWGKSTLASFLLVMLYGFGNERKKSELENDRRRFAPWTCSVYGGSLLLSAGGRRYRIERTFGTRDPREDTCLVTDPETNLPVKDLGDVPGETLFAIDRDSFVRTIFVGQQDCATQVTPGISAKIGGIADESSDMKAFSTAAGRLKSELDSLSPSRKTGTISRLETRIATLESSISGRETLENALENVQTEKKRCEERIGSITREMRSLQAEMSELGKQKDMQSGLDQLELLKKAEDRALEQFREERTMFPGKVPDTAELDFWMEEASKGTLPDEDEDSMYALQPKERETWQELYAEFEEGVPAEEELNAVQDKLRSAREEGAALKARRLSEEENRKRKAFRERFKEYLPTEEEVSGLIREWSERTRKKENLDARRSSLKAVQGMLRTQKEELEIRMAEEEAQRYYDENLSAESEETGSPLRRLAVFLGCALLVIGLLLSGLIYKIVMEHKGIFQAIGEVFRTAFNGSPEITLGMLAVIMMALGILLLGAVIVNLVLENRNAETDDGISEEEAAFREAVDDYRAEKKAIKEDEQLIAKVDQVMQEFLERTGITAEEEEIADSLYELRSEIREYTALQQRYREYRESSSAEAREKQLQEVRSFLQKYYPDMDQTEDPAARLQQLRMDVQRYHALEERIKLQEKNREKTENRLARVSAYIAGLGIEPQEDMRSQLRSLRDCRRNLLMLQKEYRERRRAREEFQEKLEAAAPQTRPSRKNYISGEGAGSEDEMAEERRPVLLSERSLEELNAALVDSQEELEKCQELLAGCVRQERELNEELDEIAAGEAELEESRETLKNLQHRYEIASAAKAYLEQAKIQFSARYMGPVKEAFDRWYMVLSGEDGSQFRMDANLELTIREAGAQRPIGALSEGWQDMAGLCRRLAMADVMYEGEKPFLIMDDPFVNLDGKKLEGARRLLAKAAETYQIIYFSCHESRV